MNDEDQAAAAPAGYGTLSASARVLTPLEQDTLALVRAHAEATRTVVEAVQRLNEQRFAGDDAPGSRNLLAEANRWAATARTQLQQGYMALNRAIALPTTF